MATIADAERDQEERDNFFRLTLLLFRLGNTKLREYLKSQWPTVYLKANPGSTPTPWADTPADAVALKTISKPSIRFRDQQTIFDSGNTNDWDFTLLRLVLATYTLGFVVKNSAEDVALEDMRVIRNTLIGHAPDAKISNATFNTEWAKACKALGRFNATQDEFDAVEKDVKKPVDSLIPLLKECVKADQEMLTCFQEFEKKAEERHKELMETQDRHHDETINAIKEEGLSIIKAIEESSKPKSPEMRQLQMAEDQRRLLQERLPHFENDVIATDLLDNLPCLTEEQKDQIAYDEKNYQISKGVRTLVDKLEEHEEGFEQFVKALAKADLGHVAVILDADFKNHVEEEEEDIPDFIIDGTAADTQILVRIWNSVKVRQWDLEERIASQFEKSSSSDSRKLRRYFEEELPQGIFFVHTTQLGGRSKNAKEKLKDDVTRTKKDSVVFVFRVAKVKALDGLWEMYSDQILKEKITGFLVSRFLSKDPSEKIIFELLFEEENYMEKRNNLQGPESIEEEPELSIEGTGAELIDSDTTGTDTPAHSHRHLSKVYLGDTSQKELQLRDYQKELAAPALEGKNTIICAPTNSGKTFVAMEIAKRHLDAYKDCQNEATSHIRTPKVIFAVNKLNLVLQQRARFEEYLYGYDISDISGDNSDRNPLDLLIKENDVIVLTAQILVNALVDKSVNIRDISLLLFDECHHTIGDGPYNMIMKTYVKHKLNENDNGNLPQVVGLTASLGVGQSNRPKEHILQMCANLDASNNISTVRKNIEELTMYVTGGSPNRKVITVNNDAQNVFELEFNKAMKEIEGFINERGTYCPPPSTDRQSSGYRQWIENLSKYASIQKYSDMFLCGEHLRCYHEALLINNVVRIDDAIAHLETFSTKRDPTKSTDPKLIETDSWLRNVYQKTKQLVEKHKQEAPENPLLEALKKEIIDFHEAEKESGAKGILFAQRRAQTAALKKWTEETEELNEILKPDILVGSGDSMIGLSQPQQERVIKKFKNGDINIIIATTVAEEGLDISDCCYVIRYGVKTNEISSVQARGRIRAKDGNYVYIGDSRSRGADHELMNA